MNRKARRRLRIGIACGLLLALSSCMFLPNFPRIVGSGKYDPVDERQSDRPRAIPVSPIAEKQTEPHTCGWHAMRSMYAAYGLDAEAFKLRFRLGTDEPAMRSDKDSTGTLHPDLYRVLAQDGFASDAIDLESDVAVRILQNHLAQQQLALAVVYRNTYHWVLIGPGDQVGELRVYDSLKPEPVAMTIDSFLSDALSITLVEPNDGEALSSSEAHAEGVSEMARLYRRKE